MLVVVVVDVQPRRAAADKLPFLDRSLGATPRSLGLPLRSLFKEAVMAQPGMLPLHRSPKDACVGCTVKLLLSGQQHLLVVGLGVGWHIGSRGATLQGRKSNCHHP
jgi:hypothetical protein